jgi:hypothetical protein
MRSRESVAGAATKLAALGVLAGLLLTAAPARAIIQCAQLSGLAQQSFIFMADQLDEAFGVDLDDESLCKKLTKNFIKACHEAVKDALACWQAAQVKGLTKQNTEICKVFAKNPSSCIADYKEEGQEEKADLKEAAKEQRALCSGTQADNYFDVCMFGP